MKANIYIIYGSDENGLIDAIPEYSFASAKKKMIEMYNSQISKRNALESSDTYVGEWGAKIYTSKGIINLQIKKAEIDTKCLFDTWAVDNQCVDYDCYSEMYTQLSFIPVGQQIGFDFNDEPLESEVNVGADGTLTPVYKNQISIF